jgi:dTDP-4-dehydrorhamnose 3,5-epimerase
VNVRQGPPNFGKWCGTTLDEERIMYIPPDFAHGFLVLSEIADFIYKCTDYYHPESEQGILWNDPDIGIKGLIGCCTVAKRPSKSSSLRPT